MGWRDVKYARAHFRPSCSNESSVVLKPLYGLFRSQRGVDVSVRVTLEVVEKRRVVMHGSSPALCRPM